MTQLAQSPQWLKRLNQIASVMFPLGFMALLGGTGVPGVIINPTPLQAWIIGWILVSVAAIIKAGIWISGK